MILAPRHGSWGGTCQTHLTVKCKSLSLETSCFRPVDVEHEPIKGQDSADDFGLSHWPKEHRCCFRLSKVSRLGETILFFRETGGFFGMTFDAT
jgi:hypothetical protein